MIIDHLGHGEAILQTPQVLPDANLMNPFSPQPDPHEFLIFQALDCIPTKRTAWLILLPQLLKTPDEYLLQFVASTVTETG